MSILELIDVSKSYGEKLAVDNASFSVEKGEVFGLLGPNGAGKTSIIRMIMDIIKPDSGKILFNGKQIDHNAKNFISYLPEERGLYPRLKVQDVLVFLAQLKGVPVKIAKERIKRYLARIDMPEVINKRMRELSKGMQQLINFVSTLICEPYLLILDEPFMGLDPANRVKIIDILREVSAGGTTVLLSTHLMDQVEMLCDRIAFINFGKIAYAGGIREVKESFADNAVLVWVDGQMKTYDEIEKILDIKIKGMDYKKIFLKNGITIESFLKRMIEAGERICHFERALPSLEEVFIKIAGS